MYKSRITIESKTHPGVFITLKKVSDARRSRLRHELANPVQSNREITAEVLRLGKDGEEDIPRLEGLGDKIDINNDAIKQAWFRTAFVSAEVNGEEGQTRLPYTIDDEPATVDSMIEDGPVDLFDEICGLARKTNELSAEEAGE